MKIVLLPAAYTAPLSHTLYNPSITLYIDQHHSPQTLHMLYVSKHIVKLHDEIKSYSEQ